MSAFDGTEERVTLTSQTTVVDLHFVGGEDTDVSWDTITSFDQHDVTTDDDGCLDLGFSTIVTDDGTLRGYEVLKFSHDRG